MVENTNRISNKNSVAVPAQALVARRERNGAVIRFLKNRVSVEGAFPWSEALVCFLQGQDVAVQFLDNLERPVRPPARVDAY